MTYHVFVTTPRAGLGAAVAPYTVECKEVFATRAEADVFAAAKTLSAGVIALFDAMPSLFDPWAAGTLQAPIAYILGMYRSHLGGSWRCALSHSAAGDASWAPGGAANLWTRVPNPGAQAWQASVPYPAGSRATYGARLYAIIQAHTSQAGWEPPNVPALWSDVGAASTVVPYSRASWAVVSSDKPDYQQIVRAKEAV